MLLKNPDPKVLRAISNLAFNTDFVVVREYLEAQAADNATRLANEPDQALARWRQGVAQVLDQLLNTIATARKTLK